MKVIIAGGRDFNDMLALRAAVEASGFDVTEIVSGCAPGADTLAIYYANANGIPVERFRAQWGVFGKLAGPMRNAKMARYADALVALPGGRGTANMIQEARRQHLKVYVATGKEQAK